jgi:hypothetical protein
MSFKVLLPEYKVDMTEDKGIMRTFYDLYNEKIFGQHTTNQSLQKKLDRFRDNMAVDFYNLILETEKDTELIKGVWNRARWKNHKKMVIDYANKYLLYNQTGEKPYSFFGDQVDHKVFEFMGFMENGLQLGLFKTITDKAISGLEFDENELKVIKNWLLGDFEQGKNNDGRFVLSRIYMPFNNFGMIRALYEWVYLVSSGAVDVKVCEAGGCNKLFLPDGRGKEQIYCGATCKKRAFRHRHREDLATIMTE